MDSIITNTEDLNFKPTSVISVILRRGGKVETGEYPEAWRPASLAYAISNGSRTLSQARQRWRMIIEVVF